jgi:tetratricopeptide (TPR) repeat protein
MAAGERTMTNGKPGATMRDVNNGGAYQTLPTQWTWQDNAPELRTAPTPAPAAPNPSPLASIEAAEHLARARIAGKAPEAAIQILRTVLTASPDDVAAMRLIAMLNAGLKRYMAAESRLERALQLAPHYTGARNDYVNVLIAQMKAAQALPHLEILAAENPENANYRVRLAWCLGNIGDLERAMDLYEESIEDLMEQPKLLLHYATLLRYAGHRDESVQICRICQEVAPTLGEAWWTLADVKTERFSEADVAAMNALLENPDATDADRTCVHYALGQALEQARDYPASFAHFAKGAALKRAAMDTSALHTDDMVRDAKRFYTPQLFAQRAGWGCADPAPIFIVGMPRAGSTLVEQILSSHSQVEGTRELPVIGYLVSEIAMAAHARGNGLGFPDCLAAFDRTALAEVGERYLERTRIYRRTDRPFFIDKAPSNWIHAGLINLILPHAKIIDARRHPMANGFAMFKHLFGNGASYSHDLTDIGHFYSSYVDAMAHFDRVMPGRVHRVIYERMVADTETEIRKLLDYCGLPFEPGCLRFWESKRDIATPSAEQVRQPIYRSGLDHWRNYEPWLDELKRAVETPGALAWDGQASKEAVLF